MTEDLFASEPAPTQGPRVFTVSEITRSVRICLEKNIGQVWVRGEICNYRKQASGHQYFGLKDEGASLGCVLFYKASLRQPALAEGMLVQVRGDLTVYEARGQYQLVVNLVQAAGAGLLQARFEALKRKLEAEGLFASERKKPLPKFPRAIGIVTSPSGAAIHDLLNIVQRRAPWMRVVINPVRVQGAGAALEIVEAVREFNEGAHLPPVEVIVICRGGGSAEDLWEFNEEVVARAIFASGIPVVTAIGHETDFTIADFAADLRAPTPSAAAELVAPDSIEIARSVAQLTARLRREMNNCLTKSKSQLAFLERSASFREPEKRIERNWQQIDGAAETMQRAVVNALMEQRQRLERLLGGLRRHRPDQLVAAQRQKLAMLAKRIGHISARGLDSRRQRVLRIESMLRLLSPEATLSRGYSITMNADGQVVRSAVEVKSRMKLVTRLRDGVVTSTVK